MASNPADGRKVGWSSSRKYVIQLIPAIGAEQQTGDGLLNLAYGKLAFD